MADVSLELTLSAWVDNNITVRAVQGEVDGRSLIVILNNAHNPIDLTGATITINMIKPDGTESYQAFQIIDAVNGKIKVTLTSQVSAVIGEIDCEIRVTQAGGQTTKWTGLKINVVSGHGDGAIESQSEFTALQTLIGQATGLNGRLTQAETDIDNLETTQNNILDGTTKVGNADKLDGYDSTYFASQATVNQKVNISDIKDNLTSSDIDKPLSAKQGSVLKTLIDTIALTIYPVGSIYMSVNDTDPSTLFGGTWVAWGSGRVPVGVDIEQTEFNTVEKTGGNKNTQSHTHGFGYSNVNLQSGSTAYALAQYNGTVAANGATSSYGAGDSQNLQPYITCYMWKRTA